MRSTYASGPGISIDASLMQSHITRDEILSLSWKLKDASELLLSKQGAGSDFTGWLDPSDAMVPQDEIARLENAAAKLREDTDYLVVIGIGGSYLGARACYEALRQPGTASRLKYAGINMSSHYLTELI